MIKPLKLCVIAICLSLLFTSCKSEDVFRDYTLTESYNSSAVVIDTTDLSEIVYIADGVTLVDFTPKVTAGDTNSITLKAKSNTEYKIQVEYSSGISKSKSLVPKISDNNGYITWEWQVGAKCKAGRFPIRIYQSDDLVFETRLIIMDI